jgi:hypothetical protein
MKVENIAEERRTLESLHGHKGNDPLEAQRRESKSLNTAWFKNGESLNLIQRPGFTRLSLFFFASGLYIAVDCIQIWREGISTPTAETLFFLTIGTIASLFFLAFGVLGLRNVLRFKKENGGD